MNSACAGVRAKQKRSHDSEAAARRVSNMRAARRVSNVVRTARMVSKGCNPSSLARVRFARRRD